jgi:hypothetical protein
MPPHREEIVIVPAGYDPDRVEEYRRRIERFEERQLAARTRSIDAQRRFRVFVGVVVAGLLLTGAISAFVAYSLGQLKQTVSAQLVSAEQAVAASNQRWQDTRQALIDTRTAVQSSEQLLTRLRAETRVGLLLPYVDTYLDRRLPAADDSIDRTMVAAKLKEIVQPALLHQLTQNSETPDSQLNAQIEKLIDARLAGVLQRSHRPQ